VVQLAVTPDFGSGDAGSSPAGTTKIFQFVIFFVYIRRMKGLLVGILTFVLFICTIIWLDSMLVSALLDLFPDSASEWFGVIKVGLWILVISFTGGISFAVAMVIAAIVTALFSR
jgi:hypothetical protein